QLGDDPGADLGGEHVAERVRDHLAQVAPGREHPGVGRRADRAVEVRALDPALKTEDEDQAPDHDRGAEDQDPGLAERLAEELEDPAAVDQARDPRAEPEDLPDRGEPPAGDGKPAGAHGYLITCSSGCVASSVWVKT